MRFRLKCAGDQYDIGRAAEKPGKRDLMGVACTEPPARQALRTATD